MCIRVAVRIGDLEGILVTQQLKIFIIEIPICSTIDEIEGKNILKIPKFLKTIGRIGKKASRPPEILNPTMSEISDPSETVESLLKYETESGQAQKFLGTFDEHKDSWVLIYNQEVKKYGPEYKGKELEDLENEMPGAVYLPIDKKCREGSTGKDKTCSACWK
ncbi:hypothetical protein Glove_123g56 [Diversispora epigaea]|uniref:Uncharacterized protein n=1 Tax=Diversispora epigaea TaxID=1348612 RepID=A0A397J7H4_9GLOM|nr:hypothetical protein Glove_123g56 [Diversispora epigaea]